MRRTWRGWSAALVLGLGLAAAACGEVADAPRLQVASQDPFCLDVVPRVQAWVDAAWSAHPAPDDPRYGGTAVVGTIGELADGMNAFVAGDYGATQHQQFLNLMTLIQYDAELNPVPYLAESWEVNQETTEITFHIRRDVVWHDGEPTDAHDVAFTYLRVTDPATAFPNATFWNHYVTGPEGVEVLDDYTVRIRLEPHGDFMDPWRTVSIMPEHLLGEVPPEELREHPFGTQCPVGNGPFVFLEHRPQDRWVFAANPVFPEGLGGRPFLDRYVYRVIPEQTTLLAELLTENIDVYAAPRPDQAARIEESPNLVLHRHPFRQYVFVAWNGRRPQFADARVRRAITLGTNRHQIVEAILSGYGTVANSSIPPFHWAYDPETGDAMRYDPAAAAALLEEAGWTDRDGDGVRENPDGVRLAFTLKYNQGNQIRQSVAEIMQAQLAQLGMEVRPQVVEWTTLVQQLTDPEQRDFDGVVMSWITEFKVDDYDLFHSSRGDGLYAWTATNNPRLDRLLEELSRAVDREAALGLWREYQEELALEQPYTFFYFPDRLDGINVRLKNWVMDARGEWVNAKDWWIER